MTAPARAGAVLYVIKVHIMKTLKTLIVAALFALSAVLCAAQNFEPTTTWPYIYENFMPGKLVMNTGKVVEGKYNICIDDSRVHFIDGDMVKQASVVEVVSVQIGNDVYINAAGRMMKVLQKSDKGVVAEDISIDYARLNETGGAYGSSSSSIATTALSSLEGIGGTRTNMNHMELKSSKENGKTLTLNKKLYLVFGGRSVLATKRDVQDMPGIDKTKLKSFLKSNKIKWKEPVSLIVLVDYLADNQQ